MISLRFLRRSPGLENETDIQFRDSKRGRGEEGHPLFFYFLLDTDRGTNNIRGCDFMSAGSGRAAGSRRSDPNRNPARLRS